MPPLTRRDFLRTLLPAWLTRRIVLVAVATLGGLFVSFQLAKVLREQGLEKSAAFLTAVWLAVFLLSRLSSLLRHAVAGASADFRAFVSKLSRVFECVVLISVGAYLHAQWSSGADITSTLVALGSGLLVAIFRDEKQH
jgi:hypothetical protein